MDKSILVMDTPKCCGFCPLSGYSDDGRLKCKAKKYGYEIPDDKKFSEKPDWCPLKPAPQPTSTFYREYSYAAGYNQCICDILN